MSQSVVEKKEKLFALLRGCESILVAYSGGVDSSLLLWAAVQALGKERVTAVHAQGVIYLDQDSQRLANLPKRLGARYLVVSGKQMEDPAFTENPIDRCYICKHGILVVMKDIAIQEGIQTLADGSNVDDQSDYRPGMKAVEEFGVRSPLLEAGLTKAEVRELAHGAGIENWDAPADSCLAARFPYGQTITLEALNRIRKSESVLKDLGFKIVRVRDYGEMARIEVAPSEIDRFSDPDLRRKAIDGLRDAGYHHVALDLAGYRRGSMNEGIIKKE